MSRSSEPFAEQLLENRTPDLLVGRRIYDTTIKAPKFEDSVWDLSGAKYLPTSSERSRLRVRFDQIPEGFRREVKLYLATRLVRKVPLPVRHRKRRPAVGTVADEFKHLILITRGLKHLGVPNAKATSQSDLDQYLSSLLDQNLASSTVNQQMAVLRRVYHYQQASGSVWFDFEPFRNRPAFAKARGENTTPRIPEEVFGALIEWALFYVETAAPDLLSILDEMDTEKVPCDLRTLAGKEQARNVLTAYVERRRKAGRGLPAYVKTGVWNWHDDDSSRWMPNEKAAATAMGLAATGTLREGGSLRDQWMAAIDELGLERGDFEAPLSDHPTSGRPWRPGVSLAEVSHEINNLKVACFVLCLLSGMRQAEVRALKRGAYRREGILPGGPYRHKLDGSVNKGRATPKDASWIIIPEIASAVAVAERLALGEYLFGTWRGESVRRDRGVDSKAVIGCSNYNLNVFLHVTIPRLARFNGLKIPELVEKKGWRLTGKQFRRTVAFYIARQPFGIVAGKIQYKHLSVAAFEGYAGTSASGFLAEIESEMQLAGASRMTEIYEASRNGLKPGGPAGKRVHEICEAIRHEVGDLPGHIVDEKRLRTMLRQQGRSIYIGPMTDCFYEEKDALCRGQTKEKSGPVIAECDPAGCPNSCATHPSLPDWEAAVDDAKSALSQKGLSELQRSTIKRSIDTYSEVVRSLKG